MQRLYDFAAQYVEESELAEFKKSIDAFLSTYNTGTDIEIKTAAGLAPMMLGAFSEALMSKGKAALKALVDGKEQTGDNQACKDIISGAKDRIDALEWDESKTVAENTATLDAAVRAILAAVDTALANARIATGMEEAKSEKSKVEGSKTEGRKMLRNGQVLIEKDGRTYNITGAEVR